MSWSDPEPAGFACARTAPLALPDQVRDALRECGRVLLSRSHASPVAAQLARQLAAELDDEAAMHLRRLIR